MEATRLALSAALGDFEFAKESDDAVVVQFTRNADDDTLDRAVRALHTAGGRILAADSERATLLDVLEKYEREDETHEGERP